MPTDSDKNNQRSASNSTKTTTKTTTRTRTGSASMAGEVQASEPLASLIKLCTASLMI